MNGNMFRRCSIKTRVTLFTLGIFLLSTWVVVFYAGRMLQADMRHLLGEQQYSAVSLLADQVNDSLSERLSALAGEAGLIDQTLLENRAALQARLDQHPNLQALFNAGLFVTGLDGTALVSVPAKGDYVGVNYLDRDYMLAALKEGRASVGRPVMGKHQRTPLFALASPLRDAQGRVMGALVGVVDLARPSFLDKLADKPYGRQGGYLLVAAQHRLIVTGSDKRRVMETLPAAGVNPHLDRFIDGFEGSDVFVNPVGVEVLASVKRIPVAAWYMAAILPTEVAFAPIHAMNYRILIGTLVLTLLAGALTWWLLRRELSPLLDAAKLLAAVPETGQLSQPLPVARQDEAGALVASFNRLLAIVKARQDALQRSETRLTSILDQTQIHLWAFDGERYTFINKQWFDFTGQDPAATMTPALWAAVVHPDDLPRVTEVWRTHWASKTPYDHQVRLRRYDGVYRDFDCHTLPVLNGNGEFQYFQGFNLDVTERKWAERQERFRMKALEQLVAGAPVARILETLVLGVEDVNPDMLGSVWLLDGDGRHLGQGVSPSLPTFFNAAVDGLEVAMGAGSCGTAAFTGERVIAEDLQTHPYWAPYSVLARQAGLGACWSQPILSSARQVLGTFAIYHRMPYKPDEDEIRLIEECAKLASIAIEKSRATRQLHDSEARFRSMMEDISGVAVQGYAMDGTVTFWNHAAEALYGYSAREALGAKLLDLIIPSEMHPDVREAMARMASTGVAIPAGELLLKTKAGTLVPVFSSHVVVKPEAGPMELFCLDIDLTERKRMEEQVRKMAFYDPLTRLPNRRLLNDRLGHTLAASQRNGLYGALMFLDLDNFKPLNDQHGHGVGDLLLLEVAHRLTECVREVDTVARLGGDEFVVMLSELHGDLHQSIEQAHAVAEKIRLALSETYFLSVAQTGHPAITVAHHCSASIGVAMFVNHELSATDILKAADAAMYQAKNAGRNTVRFHGSMPKLGVI